MKKVLLLLCFASLRGYAQNDVYYAGINPVAPFTTIRSHFAGGTLPAAGNLESGISVFIGKIWNRNYNVETRVSYGSPFVHTRQFLVQSGMMYCFNQEQASLLNSYYAGLFVKLQEMSYRTDKNEKGAAILYWSAGKRFVFGRCFADVRISQYIAGLKWSDEAAKAANGFHSPGYNWKSPYVPFAGIGLGYIISREHKIL